MDSLLTLSFSIQNNKGIYALLLGSGISRSAGIPTGWEIVIDLVRKIAKMGGEIDVVDPETWYIDKYGKEPSYSEILAIVARTPSERQHLLESYFEPTDEERENGIKLPTQAHREIAKLIKAGYVKVVVTTNFDRLLETALQDEGIIPTVISNSDSAKGAIPLVHSNCTILKLHGDYKDVRIKNTYEELEEYEPIMKSLLNRVFDEYGFIICGWSAEWDIALRNALLEKVNRRYPVYWTGLDEPQNKAKDLVDFLSASFIGIENADSFFTNIAERVQAIDSDNLIHPTSIKTAVAMLKKYLPKPENRIRLHDMVGNEVKRMISKYQEICKENTSPDAISILKRLKAYESSSLIGAHLFATGSYFDITPSDLWYMLLSDIANSLQFRSGSYVVWNDLALYPAMLIYYVSGIACMLSRNYANLFLIMCKTKIKDINRETLAAYSKMHPALVFGSIYNDSRCFGKTDYKTPAHDYMYDVVKPFFEGILLSEEKYQLAFDSFEYLNGLLYATSANNLSQADSDDTHYWGPTGCFYWRRSYRYTNGQAFYNNNELIDYDKLLEFGFWNGDRMTLESHKKSFDTMIKSLPVF